MLRARPRTTWRQRPRYGLLLLLVSVALGPVSGFAQPIAGEQPVAVPQPDLNAPGIPNTDLYYNVTARTTVYRDLERTEPYLQLGLREEVTVVERLGEVLHIRTQDGARGYVAHHEVSNIWMRVDKRRQTLYVYRGVDLLRKFPVDLGYNTFADKERRGAMTEPDHWRTPEGTFYVVTKNPYSKYYKALVLNYPNSEDAARGLAAGLIDRRQHDAIVAADRAFQKPPMYTSLGGYIEIHGDGTGVRSNWTQGCIAIHNNHIDDLWELVHVGTPVFVEP